MKKGIYIDVTNLVSQGFLTGIQRVVRESVKNLFLLQPSFGFEVVPIVYDSRKRSYRILTKDNFLKWDRSQIGTKPEISDVVFLPEQIPSGSVLLDVDSVWAATLKRSNLLPILKRREIKIACFLLIKVVI